MSDPIAQAIRDEVRIGPFAAGSNALFLLNRGGSIRLNLHEADTAAEVARQALGTRTVTDLDELSDIPAGSVGIDAHGTAIQCTVDGLGATWRVAGSNRSTFPGELSLPVRFLQLGW